MSATAKFYTAFFLALAIVVAIGAFAGYRFGTNRQESAVTQTVSAYRSCLRKAKVQATTSGEPANRKYVDAFLLADDCARLANLPFFSPTDLYDITGVMVKNDFEYNDPSWKHPDVPRNAKIRAFGASGLGR